MFPSSSNTRAIVAGAILSVAISFSPSFAATEATQSGGAPSQRTEALRVALAAPDARRDAGLDAARTHYGETAYRGIWLTADGDETAALALMDALADAPSHGLPANRYRLPVLRAALAAAKTGGHDVVATAELALTRAFLTYARDLSSGLLEPKSVDRELHVFPERPVEDRLLRDLRAAPSKAAYLAGLAPADPGYELLRAELAALSAAGPGVWGPKVPEGGTLRFGERGPRIAALRARLMALGDLFPSSGDEDVFDEVLEIGLQGFQRRHGLNDDGVAGPRTLAAVNAGVEDRLNQVVVNLERMRWLNRDLGFRHIYVNQADFTVRLIENGAVLFQERVVVGKARRHRTPEFSDQMTHMVFNPTWYVPRSIATEEILPKLKRDPSYLSRRNMRLTSGGRAGPSGESVDWSVYSASDFPFRVQQRPGAGNALGRVKFMFPNQFAIYLHDTPSKKLFAKDARAFSHGCVRVQDPMGLARALLAPQTDDATSFVDKILNRGRERRVDLAEPVQVHLTYRTAWVDELGERQFRDDVYGRDARILSALQAEGVRAGG